ncbi:ATP synthase F1 subunit epsilon [Lujinxingia litoralis]|uniref:ATP synthase epsilon chain n=1 Tax=Lujinxingia litoralis TaxID=2211119 RepID=A0A328C374_9DELT|nr:ATP synthase F1 subunit epsilon [Lujinxingia litoralis]RAL20251.1 ATP synthase F1 subunit epsilon [Lujinxingia litoralis]
MAETLHLEVVTPEKAVFSEPVDDVVLPGFLGQMDILPGHLPMLSVLAVGEMIVTREGTSRHFFVEKGYVEIFDDRVTVLTEGCSGVNEIDVEHARRDLERYETRMAELEERSKTELISEDVFEQHRQALKRERMKLAFAKEGKIVE